MRPRRRALLWCLGLGVLFAALLLLAPPGGSTALPLTRPFLPPGALHPFGTDDLGRDMLAAVAQGARTSLLVGLAALALAFGIGVAVGIAAGLGGALLDEALMRLTDIVASLPTLLLAILVATFFGGSAALLAVVLGFTRWTVVARLVRVETQTLARREFFTAAIALGCGPLHIARRHVLGHVLAVTAPAGGVVFAGAIMAEATLAFVGLGDPDLTSWGRLIAAGFGYVEDAWWMWVFPAASISLTTMMVALASDALSRLD